MPNVGSLEIIEPLRVTDTGKRTHSHALYYRPPEAGGILQRAFLLVQSYNAATGYMQTPPP